MIQEKSRASRLVADDSTDRVPWVREQNRKACVGNLTLGGLREDVVCYAVPEYTGQDLLGDIELCRQLMDGDDAVCRHCFGNFEMVQPAEGRSV